MGNFDGNFARRVEERNIRLPPAALFGGICGGGDCGAA